MEFELTEAERAQWDVDPDEWPHTPPFGVFAALYDEDHNLWWRAGSGHGMNAYDAARDRIDDVEAVLDQWNETAQLQLAVSPTTTPVISIGHATRVLRAILRGGP